jgi:hypothetical protein
MTNVTENSFAELYRADATKWVYFFCQILLTFFGPALLYSVTW